MFTISTKQNTITALRVKEGLSIRKLAKVAGINFKTVYSVEKSAVSPTPATAKKICDALGASFDDLFELKESR